MKILFNQKFLDHNPDSYAEGPYRIVEFPEFYEDKYLDGEEYITLVHSKDYLELIKNACVNREVLAEVYLSPNTYDAAITAVGLTVLAAEQGDFAVVRPPGHHAKPGRADGFCLFNNIAIATQKLVNEGKKVFILDFDGHHGDGTQQIFYRSDRVLYCSIHQQYTYPWTGKKDETGEGEGKGFTMNFPLPAGSGDKEFLGAVDEAIIRAKDFKPDVVGVSAGFDAYEKDRLLNLKYTLDGYYQCGLKLSTAFENIFAVLEGGYHLDIRKCAKEFIRGVNTGLKN
jgi:acetoin utilization deacetylase AcuC-like enzyme